MHPLSGFSFYFAEVKNISIFLLFFISTFSLQAQIGGQNIFSFINLPNSARVQALGGSAIAFRDDDVNMAYQNPGLINSSMANRLSLNYVNYFSDINFGNVAYAFNIKKAGTLALSMQYIDYGNFERADYTGLVTGEFTAGLFCFVEEGTINGDSGFVCTNDGVITLGSSPITFAQFSGAGQVIAGAGLTKTGNQIDVGAGNGITVNANDVALATTVAGNGLTYTSGVLDVVGTASRISVSSDSIDISSSYVGQASIVTVGTLTTGALGVGFTTVNVAQGGTGVSSFTSNGVVYGNGTGALQATTVATIAGSYLRQDASGAPYWSAEVDGGTY